MWRVYLFWSKVIYEILKVVRYTALFNNFNDVFQNYLTIYELETYLLNYEMQHFCCHLLIKK